MTSSHHHHHHHHHDLDPYIDMIHAAIEEIAKLLIQTAPHARQFLAQAIEGILAPRAIARQLVVVVALETGVVTLNQILNAISYLSSFVRPRQRLVRRLRHQQKHDAQSQDEWMELAERIDNIQGDDVWRSDPNCQLYERERISARIDEFVHLMRRRDVFELMFVLRGGIGRNKFGLLHEGLFSKALAGSKVLVETYHNVVCAALDFVCDAPVAPGEAPVPTDARLAFFNETRHSYGRTALLLSGGAALGFYHIGVVRTLMNNRLMPRVIGGSSAGSIVCSMIGTRTDEECMNDLFEIRGTNAPGHSGELALEFFRPLRTKEEEKAAAKNSDIGEVLANSAGAFKDAKRTWQMFFPIGLRRFTSLFYDLITGNRRPQDLLMSDTEHFRRCCRINIGDFTFQEAFDRTGRILNVTVTPNNSSDPPRLLNYLTAPHVLVWSAVVASSSVPGVFEANRLMVRDADGTERYESSEGAKFSDGSIEQDLPMQQLSEMFNVNHFIISQANPHAVMFASYNQDRSIWINPITGMMNAVLTYLKNRLRSWLADVVELAGARRIAPRHATSRGIMSQFFTQEYEGRDCDISLIPWLNHRSVWSALLHFLYNPSEEQFKEWIEAAERETWKHIPAIKSHIAEEVTLDRCVQRLRKRVIKESATAKAAKMGDRVPSFFTSPSLVKLGGLGILDQTSISNDYHHHRHNNRRGAAVPVEEIQAGWNGFGLRGNRSCGSLERSPSNASGLFIEGDDTQEQQQPGEQTQPKVPSVLHKLNLNENDDNGRYIKTTSMARFYYQKHMVRSKSHNDNLPDSGSSSSGSSNNEKSKSHTDLVSTSLTSMEM